MQIYKRWDLQLLCIYHPRKNKFAIVGNFRNMHFFASLTLAEERQHGVGESQIRRVNEKALDGFSIHQRGPDCSGMPKVPNQIFRPIFLCSQAHTCVHTRTHTQRYFQNDMFRRNSSVEPLEQRQEELRQNMSKCFEKEPDRHTVT